MKKLLFFVLLSIATIAFAQNAEWIQTQILGSTGDDAALGIAIDSQRNVIFVGEVEGDIDVDDEVFENQGGKDFFIMKRDRFGEAVWTIVGGSNADDVAYKVAVDNEDNIYVIGAFGGTIYVGDETFITEASSDVFVAKISPDGDPIWIRTTTGSADCTNKGYGIFVDDAVYITGVFEGDISFGNLNYSGNDNDDIFVAKLSLTGEWQNAFIAGGGGGYEAGEAISLDSEGNIYVTGHVYSNSSINGEDFTADSADGIIFKLNSDFEFQWYELFGGSSLDMGLALTINEMDEIFVGGFFKNNASFGDLSLTSVGQYDTFIGEINSAGDWQWVQNYGSTSHDIIYGMSMFGDNILVAGRFRNEISFSDEISLTSNGSEDAFVALMDTEGNCLWAFGGGSSANDNAYYALGSETGQIYFTGFFNDNADFNGEQFNSEGGEDAFVGIIIDPTPLSADFDASPISGESPLSVDFQNLSTGVYSEILWDFDNDGNFDSDEENPTYTYTEAGIYSVTLQVSNELTSDTMTMMDFITVEEPILLEALFSANQTEITAPDTVFFVNQSLGNPTIFEWDFDNDGVLDSNDENPNFVYIEPGVYSVSLNVSDGENSSNLLQENYITVNAPQVEDILTYDVNHIVFDVEADIENGVAVTFTNHSIVDLMLDFVGPVFTFEETTLVPAQSDVIFHFSINIADLPRDYDVYNLDVNCMYGTLNIPVLVNQNLTSNEDLTTPLKTVTIFPNPFNPTTNISFEITNPQNVSIDVYNVLGQKVCNLVNDNFAKGVHTIQWNGKDNDNFGVGSGVYFLKLKTESNVVMKKMLLLK